MITKEEIDIIRNFFWRKSESVPILKTLPYRFEDFKELEKQLKGGNENDRK